MALINKLTAIADAIRAKTGKEDTLTLDQMPLEIAGIQTGVELNFKVVGGTIQPTSPSENTIWVNTSTTITSWVFSATQPARATGRVWISVGASSPVAFNALKKNNITVYPISAKQYVSDKWIDKTAKSYQGGKWVDWWNGHLYEYGNLHEQITDGWTSSNYRALNYQVQSTFNADNIQICGTNGVAVGGVGTVNKIDLSSYTKLKLLYSADYVGTANLSVLTNQSDDIVNAPLATANITKGSLQTAVLDITAITEGYVAVAASSTLYIYDIWLE